MARRRGNPLRDEKAVTSPARVPSAMIALVAAAASGVLVGLVPFGASQPTDWPALALALTAAIGLWVTLETKGLARYLRSPLAWSWAAFLAWALVSAVSSPSFMRAIIGVYGSHVGWVTILAVGTVVFAAMETGDALRRPVRWAALALLAGQALFAIPNLVTGQYVSGTMSNSTVTGQVFVLLLPLAFAALADRSPWLRAGLVAVVLVVLQGGDARAAMAAVLMWITVMVARGAVRAGRPRMLVLGGVLGVWAAGAAALFASPLRGAAVRFASERLTLARDGWLGFLDAPLAGWGPDGYTWGAWQHVTGDHLWGPYALAGTSADPHNALIWLLVSVGIVGTALFAWVAYESLRVVLARRRAGFADVDRPFVDAVVGYALLCLLAPAALQTLPLFAVVLGAALGPLGGDPRASADVPARRPATATPAAAQTDAGGTAAAGWVIRGVSAIAILVLLLSAGTRLTIARVDQSGGGDPRRTQAAADLWRADAFLYWRASLDWGFAVRTDPSLAGSQPDLAAIDRAIALEPRNPVYVLERALTLASYRAPRAEVERAFTRASELIPGSPDPHAGLAEYRIAQGDLPAAREALDDAATLGTTMTTLGVEARYWREAGDPAKAAQFEARLEEMRTSGTF